LAWKNGNAEEEKEERMDGRGVTITPTKTIHSLIIHASWDRRSEER
jgi:hypothetical protein